MSGGGRRFETPRCSEPPLDLQTRNERRGDQNASSSSPTASKRRTRAVNVQLPDLSDIVREPVDADFNINGGLHLRPNGNGGVNFGYTPNNAAAAQDSRRYSSNGNLADGSGFSQQSAYGSGAYGGNFQPQQQQPRQPQIQYYGQQQQTNGFNGSPQNASTFTIDNPNYKFLPDQLNMQYDANGARFRFYDNNGNPTGFTNANGGAGGNNFNNAETRVVSNAEQNRQNYAQLNAQNSQQTSNGAFTNNIYGYDYRSNPGTRYT